ncbi:testis-expressed protein 101 [Camelus ferus]|uniref:Testis-expressed protein 101 n=1 Tax=Camelus ferus TaxID=419612 RepID=A0A8B8THU3_CAMFR|nr:testis-expressed protein 101 [Camelus bactrianus]XP_032341796.1 testis-expressed protein 101 [Camelus ferus]
MGTCYNQGLLLLFLLGAPTLTLQNLKCQKATFKGIEEDPRDTFNWTTEKVETCDNGALCQETVLMIKSGINTVILATKGCSSEGTPEILFVQHAPPPGIFVVSYSNYCEEPLCNNRKDLYEIWSPEETPASSESATLFCPTCVALGTCLNAPSLPCPNGTNRCYQGKLQVTGGGLNTPLEIKGCTSITGCRLMSGVYTVGPMWLKEVCPFKTLTPRKVENAAMWPPTSPWRLELLLLLLVR